MHVRPCSVIQYHERRVIVIIMIIIHSTCVRNTPPMRKMNTHTEKLVIIHFITSSFFSFPFLVLVDFRLHIYIYIKHILQRFFLFTNAFFCQASVCVPASCCFAHRRPDTIIMRVLFVYKIKIKRRAYRD